MKNPRSWPSHRWRQPQKVDHQSANAQHKRAPFVDTRSPAYKQAARKWVLGMIATPIFLVTSYVLFQRRTHVSYCPLFLYGLRISSQLLLE